jgi:hypothetical protein
VREGEGGDAAVHRGQAVERVRVREACEEALAEGPLLRVDRVPTDRLDVLHRRDEAGEELVLERPGLEATARRVVGSRPDLVRPPRCEQIFASAGDAEVRPEELVRRADQDVDSERGDVDRPVRGVMNGVGPRERTGVVCEPRDRLRVGQCAERVRRERERHDLHPVVELGGEVVEVERRVVANRGDADVQPAVVRQLEPRRDVGVVVELGDDDGVAGVPRARGGPRQREVERRHVRAEDRLVGRTPEERGRGEPCLRDQRLGPPAGLVRAADVRVRLAVVRRHRVDHGVRNLRPAGTVEEGERRAQR